MTGATFPDPQRVCEGLVKADPCVASAHIVNDKGRLQFSAPGPIDEIQNIQVSALGLQILADNIRGCMRSTIDALMSCIGMQAGEAQALVVVFFDEPAVVTRLPRLMARAVAELRSRAPPSPPPTNGGSGSTPPEARVFVSVRDLDDDA